MNILLYLLIGTAVFTGIVFVLVCCVKGGDERTFLDERVGSLKINYHYDQPKTFKRLT